MLGDEFKTSADVADKMLSECQIVATDGKPFGAEGFIRLSYATSMQNLENAIERLRNLFGTSSMSA